MRMSGKSLLFFAPSKQIPFSKNGLLHLWSIPPKTDNRHFDGVRFINLP